MEGRRFSGERLRQLRGRRDQTDLAAALRRRGFGTTQTQVSRWESGQQPRRYILEALAKELGCKVSDLFEDADEESDVFGSFMHDVEEFLRDRITVLR